MRELNPRKTALSLALVFGIFYVVCAVLFAIAPSATLGLFNSLFHGIDINQIAKDSISFGETAIGFVITVIFALIVGWLYAVFYNKLK